MTATKNKKKYALALSVIGAIVGFGGFWYVAAAPGLPFVPQQKSVSVMFLGDIMLDRKVAKMAAARGVDSLFASSTELFTQTDLRVANLEGAVTDNASIAQVDNTVLRFTFDPALAKQVMTSLNLSAVSLANNHAYDFGKSGYATTRDYVSEWGVNVFGHPFNTAGHLSTKLTARGKTICLVGFMQLYVTGTSTVTSEIQTLRPECDKVVVFPHWGDEYTHEPTGSQVAAARAFIDAGADMVIGAHPHVVQPLEVYRGKPIVYSLGNAMFDQNFSWDTTHGLAVRLDFYPNKTDLTFIPLTIEDERLRIATGAARDRVLGQVGVAVATITLP
jgi:poly-gamma-glutamate synthesis protein (capsule biosynthesis protein)